MKILIVGMPEKFQLAVADAIAGMDEIAMFDEEIFIKQRFSNIDGVVFCNESDGNIKQAKMCKTFNIPYLFCLWEDKSKNAFCQPVVVLCDNFAPLEIAKIELKTQQKGEKPLIGNGLLLANSFAQKTTISGPNITIANPRVWISAREMLERQSQTLPPLPIFIDTR